MKQNKNNKNSSNTPSYKSRNNRSTSSGQAQSNRNQSPNNSSTNNNSRTIAGTKLNPSAPARATSEKATTPVSAANNANANHRQPATGAQNGPNNRPSNNVTQNGANKPGPAANPNRNNGSQPPVGTARNSQANTATKSKQPPINSDEPTRRNVASGNPRPIPARIGDNDPTRLNALQGKVGVAKKSKRPNLWVWTGVGLLIILSGIALFVYLRTSSFVNATMGAYSAPSLLTKTVAPGPTTVPTATPAPTTASVVVVAGTPTGVAPTATPLPSPTPTPDNSPEIVQRIKRGERVTALILGYGGGGHDGGYLTDTIMVVSFDPARKAVTMVNIPRDLYAFVPYGGPKIGYWGKINSAFSYVMEVANPSQLSPRYRYTDDQSRMDAAANLTKDIVEEVTGIPIDYWAVWSFDGFRRLINAIGGVDVTIDTAFDDYEYPANDDASIDASVMHIHFDAGPAHLDGERAIEFARSRHSLQDGSDFNRSKRQMKIVQAVKEKMARPDILFKGLDIMEALQGRMRTSLSFNEARGLADYFRSSEGSAKLNNLLFVPQILSSNFLYDSSSASAGYILIPQAGQGNYKDIQDWLEGAIAAPEIRYENLTVQVQNGTGLGSKFSLTATADLKAQGFNVLQPLWANTVTTTQILDYSNGKAVRSLKALNQLFPDATVKSELKKPYPEGPDLVVVLGQDYAAGPAKKPNPTPGNEEVANLLGGTSTKAVDENMPAATPLGQKR